MKRFGFRKKGKILGLKTGYNPNSSSVGSQIPVLFAFLAGSGILTIFILHFYGRIARIIRKDFKPREDHLKGKAQ